MCILVIITVLPYSLIYSLSDVSCSSSFYYPALVCQHHCFLLLLQRHDHCRLRLESQNYDHPFFSSLLVYHPRPPPSAAPSALSPPVAGPLRPAPAALTRSPPRRGTGAAFARSKPPDADRLPHRI